MTSHGGNGASGAEVRAKLDHPVVDADGHMMECSFAVLDFVRKVAGPEIAARHENILRNDQTAHLAARFGSEIRARLQSIVRRHCYPNCSARA